MNVKENPDGSLSHFSSLRNFSLGFFDRIEQAAPCEMQEAACFMLL